MKEKRSDWVRNGRPRGNNSASYITYKAVKCCFRRKHRRIIDAYMNSQIEEIDRVAEIDNRLFWRLVNAKRKHSGSVPGSEINFEGRVASAPQEIMYEWALNILRSCTHHQKTFILIMNINATSRGRCKL